VAAVVRAVDDKAARRNRHHHHPSLMLRKYDDEHASRASVPTDSDITVWHCDQETAWPLERRPREPIDGEASCVWSTSTTIARAFGYVSYEPFFCQRFKSAGLQREGKPQRDSRCSSTHGIRSNCHSQSSTAQKDSLRQRHQPHSCHSATHLPSRARKTEVWPRVFSFC
jgi:hypothetical protein